MKLSAIVPDGWDGVGERALLASLGAVPSHGSFDMAVDEPAADAGFECEIPYIDGEVVMACEKSACGVDVDTWSTGNEVMTEGADLGAVGAGFGE